MTIADDKLSLGNKIMIYLSVNKTGVPRTKVAAARAKERISTSGVVPEGFGSNEILNSPSCKLRSSYQNLELHMSFSTDYKFYFIKINTLINEPLQSFELQ